MIEEGRALFLQIAERVEDSIIDGSLAEESQAPQSSPTGVRPNRMS